MATSHNVRFNEFLKQLPFSDAIDNMELPHKLVDSKRADYLVENRMAIIELKSIETDPGHKI